MNSTSAVATHQRRSSRSNSTSSSVVTVKKAASLSSRSGSRKPQVKARPTSPDYFGSQLTTALSSSSGRLVTSRSRPGSAAENNPALVNANINRWSHSTASSASGIDNENSRERRPSASRRMSVGQIHAGSAVTSKAVADSDRRPRSGHSPKRSPQKQDPPEIQHPLTSLRVNTANSNSNYRRQPNTPSTGSATPLTAELLGTINPMTGQGDYFEQTWSGATRETGHLTADGKTVAYHYTITSPQRRAGGLPYPSEVAPSAAPRRPASPAGNRHGHTRHREASTKGSADTAAGSSISSTRSDQSRSRGHRSPTQKTMLSKALTKANTAVLLDNAQNFEGAMEAYLEACELLQQVMIRSSDVDDRNKLSAIRTTYSNRISELRELEEPVAHHDKELPEMPTDEEAHAYYEDMVHTSLDHSRVVNGVNIPPRLESMLPSTDEGPHAPVSKYNAGPLFTEQPTPQPKFFLQTGLMPIQPEYLPPPLSPRRPLSPPISQTAKSETGDATSAETQSKPQHSRNDSSERTSWLDTIDESVSSTSSSRLSSLDFRPSVSRDLVDEIEAEFDAALNAAVEAAYLDDLTPDTVRPPEPLEFPEHPESRDMTPSATTTSLSEHKATVVSYLDDDAEEEERLLDEMTKGYVFDDFSFDKRSKSALPRESDSSGFSGRTWGSSIASTTMTSGTTLSTLAEANEKTPKLKALPMLPPPETVLPLPPIPVTESAIPPVPLMPPPPKPASRPPSIDKQPPPGVRERRLSGQNAKQLKIETNRRASISSQTKTQSEPPFLLPTIQIPSLAEQTFPAPQFQGLAGPTFANTLVTAPLTPLTSIHSGDSVVGESPATSALTLGGSQGSIDEPGIIAPSPGKAGAMLPPPGVAVRKNMSSSSLKMRSLSVNTADPTESPITPGSASYHLDARRGHLGVLPALPTPNGNIPQIAGQSIGGLYLFDDHIGTPHTPRTPRSPQYTQTNPPQALERCPESFLLRPFWLMRCLYQSVAHPRGAYITTKLFLPRDIWRVKNVKLKAVDEKISQCDLLTAALLKVAKVDNLDADAVLEELQSFEIVMDQVRTFLAKKLGGDVGLSASSSLFKSSPSAEVPPDSFDSKTSNNSHSAAKSFASGWRKLRSKSSGAAIHTNFSALPNKDTGATSGLSMPSVPMTTSSSPQSSRSGMRRIPPTAINFANMGPNANYMSSIARLFDAVQTIDQIARQVEDPGLKCSSQALVGLELSVRNAAEFFAFYVLRFVLGDVAVLLDKFVKRGSEWVLT